MKNQKIIYNGQIRDGIYGNYTKKKYKVIIDKDYGYAKLNEFPSIDYESDAYRNLVNNSSKVDDFLSSYDKEQVGYFEFINNHLDRNSIVVDCGCGGGSTLDLIKGLVKKTYAVEPFVGFHKSLKKRGHEVFSYVDEANKLIKQKPNLALSLQVIEHVEDPLDYLKSIKKLLDKNGKLIVFTPNLNDIMLKLDFKNYAPFFFRTVHNYYFTAESLIKLGLEAGFKKYEVLFYHNFGLDNTINWIKFNKPMGNTLVDGIDSNINKSWRKYLETTGQSYNVGLVLKK